MPEVTDNAEKPPVEAGRQTPNLSDIENRIVQAIAGWNTRAKIAKILPLTPDASARRYFRIQFSSPLELGGATKADSAIAMIFLSTAPAETGGAAGIPSDVTYVELTTLFSKAAVPVPQLYLDRRDLSLLLIEDCGDILLGDLLTGRPGRQPESSARVLSAYQSAVAELVRLRSIKPSAGHFLGSRRFSSELFHREVCEFRDYYLKGKLGGRTLSPAETGVLEEVLSEVSTVASALPETTVHRDYHSWNLLVQEDPRLRIRIIDFQDALQGPLHYDLAGLINDRDTDSLLGPDNYSKIVECYRSLAGADGAFEEQFTILSIQRDLKVAGRFGKLTERGVGNYQRWIPGTVRRLRSNLEFPFSASGPVSRGLAQKLRSLGAIIDDLK